MSGFVTTIRPDLDGPISNCRRNDVYYDTKQIVIQDCEVDHTVGRYTQSLTSLAFGSTSQIVIPNSGLVYEVFLHVKLPLVLLDQTLPVGWLFSLIREVTFSWGGANISNLRLSGKSLRQTNLMSCGTREKRSELLQIAGDGFVQLGGPSTIQPEGTILLALPFSNMDSHKKKPFDMSLLNNPFQIQITLNDASSIYGGTAVAPTSLVSAQVFTRQGTFADQSSSLKQDLLSNPSLMYTYPFLHRYSPSPKYGIVADGTTVNTIELLEFIESDLQTIVFSVYMDDLQKATGTNAPSPDLECILHDVELIYNGQTIYSAPGVSSRLVNMLHDSGASGTVDQVKAQVAPWTQNPYTSYTYMIPMGSMKNINFHYKYDNTGRYSSQTMQLRFRADPVVGALGTAAQLHSTYIYSASASIQNGVCNIQFA